jgi:hypothetical protein
MKIKQMSFAVMASVLAPGAACGCACGCGVFDVGGSSMLPQGPGGMVFAEYDFLDQTVNWHDTAQAPAADNADQEIRTDFTMLGLQYMFNRSWGLQAELPYDVRYYRGDAGTTRWGSFGDMRLEGIYTGFSPDMSAGVTYGLKFPTGDWTRDGGSSGLLDRDLELGTGSTDILLGGFYRHTLNSITPGLFWFAQAQLDVPVLIQDGYRPGVELDTALGLYYQGWSIGKVKITPLAQALPCLRTKDTGPWASGGVDDPPVGQPDSGYQRVLLSPGIEFDIHPWTIYADVEFTAFQDSRGDQLVAPEAFKLIISYMF